MESSTPNRTAPSRPGRFRRGRALAVTVLAARCVMQALGRYFTGLTTPARGTICPSDHGPFDPSFGQPAASR
jgi:hypothetical protein